MSRALPGNEDMYIPIIYGFVYLCIYSSTSVVGKSDSDKVYWPG